MITYLIIDALWLAVAFGLCAAVDSMLGVPKGEKGSSSIAVASVFIFHFGFGFGKSASEGSLTVGFLLGGVVGIIFLLLALAIRVLADTRKKRRAQSQVVSVSPPVPDEVVEKREVLSGGKVLFVVTFSRSGGTFQQLQVPPDWYHFLRTGDKGWLRVQGEEFHGFQKVAGH